MRYLNDRSEANLHMSGFNVLFFKCAFLAKLIFLHAWGIQSNFTRESVRLRECANTECDWEVKRGFEKASVIRAVRLRECLLAES